MFKMVEVVGISTTSYSDAVKKAVEGVVKPGQKASWFEVIEQRGAIKDGTLAQFQAKVKVAVSE